MIHRLQTFERGLLFQRGDYIETRGVGCHLIPLFRGYKFERVSVRQTKFHHRDLDIIAKSANRPEELVFVDVMDQQVALVWIDGRLGGLLTGGVHAYWTVLQEVEIEIIDTTQARFVHRRLSSILSGAELLRSLVVVEVADGYTAQVYQAGRLVEKVGAGRYAYWNTNGPITTRQVSLRQQCIEVSGQEIITADKVSLRLNAQVNYRVADVALALDSVDDQALYREAQLVLRAIVGTRELDAMLADKDSLSQALAEGLQPAASNLGLQLGTVGVRDIILPGDMKQLMNKVTEARKAAEAALINRREETAAMRSQANTAKILDANPTLMRLRELEVLERVAQNLDLTVLLGEQGLGERLAKLV